MSLPQFAPFPNKEVRQNILPEEWGVYLDAWTSLADLYLRLDDQKFLSALSEEEPSLSSFLISFFRDLAHDETLQAQTLALRKKCFFLLHRIYSRNQIPASLLIWSTLSNFCKAFPKSETWRVLLESLWKRKGSEIEKSLQLGKTSLIKHLESKKPEDAGPILDQLAPLMKSSLDPSIYMLTGSDFLDSLHNTYPNASPILQKKLVTTVYLGLIALLEGPKPNFSLLSDHLYSLKANGEDQKKSGAAKKPLISDLVTNTPLLSKIKDKAIGPEAARVRNFTASLSTFQDSSTAQPRKLVRRKVDKGKDKVEDGRRTSRDIHVHRMSLITQIQDLFPDLGTGFVAKLLHEFNDDIEQVTAHLLEDSLPAHLANADRGEQLQATTSTSKPHLTPRSTPPPYERRNMFDDDNFDKLAVDTSRLHIGRKNDGLTADKILSDRSNAPNKSTILAALAAFDSDDDERDDTYDAEDVGGAVDSVTPEADETAAEEALFKAYTATPEVFGRSAETRRGKARIALRSETGMTDEAIEGWGLMVARNPKWHRQLEAKYTAFGGQQKALASTAYHGSPAGSDAEAAEGSGDGQRGGRGRLASRGRGGDRGRAPRGGGRGGGNVAGPYDEKSTQQSRQRKEANKGSRANHNRRDQRARKMARGGFAG